jgi:polyferredoxin
MIRPRLKSLRALICGITVPLVLSAIVAGALVLDQAAVMAAALAGTGVILLVVRSFAPQDNPLRDVGEVMLRGGETDEEWLENFRRRQAEASERKLRMWRKNAWGAWLVIAALFVLLARAVIVWLWGP